MTAHLFERRVECLNQALENGKLKKSDSLMEIARNRVKGVFDGTEPVDNTIQSINSIKEYAERIGKK